MTIDKTSRRATLTVSSPSANYAFDVPIAVEYTSDIDVYDPSGNLMREDIHYEVLEYGLPAHTDNDVKVRWLDFGGTQVVAGVYTFYRTSGVTQLKNLAKGYSTGEIEAVFDRVTLIYQNALKATNNIFDTEGGKITSVVDPVEDSDACSLVYAQSEFTSSGYLPSPIVNIDEGKALFAYSTDSMVWNRLHDIPYPSVTSKILQVDGTGTPAWVNPVEYAPVFPTKPQYMTVDSSVETTWGSFRQLPLYANSNAGDTVVAQEGGTYAWHPIRWLDQTSHGPGKFLWNSTGTGDDGVVTTSVQTNYSATKVTYIYEDAATTNYGTEANALVKSKTGENRHVMFEWDLTALNESLYTMDTIVSVQLRMRFTAAAGTQKPFIFKRLPDTFVEDEATWEQLSDANDWFWTDGGINDLDHELPVPYVSVGSGMELSDYTRVDFTQLLLDALHRRDGVLRVMLYDPSPGSSEVSGTFHSNSSSAYKIRLEVDLGSARTAYWQPYNHHHRRDLDTHDSFVFQGGEGNGADVQQPHCFMYCGQALSGQGFNPHFPTPGRACGQVYAVSTELGSTLWDAGTVYMQPAVSTTPTSDTSLGAFYDWTGGSLGNAATDGTTRISLLWFENE